MPDSFSLARSTWAGTVSDLMSAGPARPFLQPWYEPISTLPSDTGMPLGGIGSAFTVTPSGTTPVLSLVPSLHVTAPAGGYLRLHDFFYSERSLPSNRTSAAPPSLIFPDYGALQRQNAYFPLVDSKGRPWFNGKETPPEALAVIRTLINTASLHADNASRWSRWKTEWSPRTRRALESGTDSAETNLLLLLDFYSGSLGLAQGFAGSLTGDAGEAAISGWPTYPRGKMEYRALYPSAETRYLGGGHAARITKVTFTPVAIGEERSHSLPVSLVEFTLENPTGAPLEITLAQTLENLCGYHVVKVRPGVQDAWFRLVATARHMEHAWQERELPGTGMRLGGILMGQQAGWEGGDLKGRMFAGVAFDPADPDVCVTANPAFYRERETGVVAEAMHTGRLSSHFDKSLYTAREPLDGALCVTARLAPGASRRISFMLVLDFPEIRFPGLVSSKRYTAFFPDGATRTLDMAVDAWKGRDRALQSIAALHGGLERAPGLDRLFPAGTPGKDRFLTFLGNLLAFYADSTVWDEQGDFLVRECADYPFFNSLDVYFYGSFSLLRLLPRTDASILRRFAAAILEENPALRRHWEYVDKPYADLPDPKLEGPRAVIGAVPHDLGSPFDCRPDAYTWHNVKEWKDLAPKYVLMVLRHFQVTGDKGLLADCWSAVESSMEYLSAMRNPGESIPLTRGTDDTFDNLSSHGISAYCGSLWIAALEASARMASILGHGGKEESWRTLAGEARRDFASALWDEKEGYYHFFATPVSAGDLRPGGEAALNALLERLAPESGGASALRDGSAHDALRAVNGFLDSDAPYTLSDRDRAAAEAWIGDRHPAHVRLLAQEAGRGKKDARTAKKLMLAALEPDLWARSFHDKILSDSDDIFCDQLLADTWMELLDLEPLTAKPRRRRILDRIMDRNFHVHSPEVGAAILVDKRGDSLPSFQAQDVWIGVQFSLASALVSADMPAEAREILETAYRNLYDRARIPFAAPEGFNGSSPLNPGDISLALGLPAQEAEHLQAALSRLSWLDYNKQVIVAALPPDAQALRVTLESEDLAGGWPAERFDTLLFLLQSWGLRYTAGRYLRPGMAFCILDILEKKVSQ